MGCCNSEHEVINYNLDAYNRIKEILDSIQNHKKIGTKCYLIKKNNSFNALFELIEKYKDIKREEEERKEELNTKLNNINFDKNNISFLYEYDKCEKLTNANDENNEFIIISDSFLNIMNIKNEDENNNLNKKNVIIEYTDKSNMKIEFSNGKKI